MKTSKILLMQRSGECGEWETVLTFSDSNLSLALQHLDEYHALFPESQHKLVMETIERMDIIPAVVRGTGFSWDMRR